MPEFLRVRVKDTKAHITIHAPMFDKAIHAELKSAAVDRNGDPLPPKYPSTDASPADDSEGEAATATTPQAEKEATE